MVKVAPRKWQPTNRNLEVLAAVGATGSRKDAAIALGISYRTVEAHMTKLRVGSHAVSDGQLILMYADRIAEHVEP
jgi:molybdenum-dependent DNA-binding transcriptional regulator ModE